ncbi:hypothetical protein [Haladaptatus halobius]|uniref:hypothetical protein n=1 Tax=Haladaptatus halobius TaxID=2884875 RepID=UPI001D0B4E9C|nr:hypothetical protein [Haladaptatus halobius]
MTEDRRSLIGFFTHVLKTGFADTFPDSAGKSAVSGFSNSANSALRTFHQTPSSDALGGEFGELS